MNINTNPSASACSNRMAVRGLLGRSVGTGCAMMDRYRCKRSASVMACWYDCCARVRFESANAWVFLSAS
ncbi:hypothetical protein D3C84_1248630 [compost metagenome]